MNIGIIGSGNIGAILARHFTRLGHSVRIANSRGPETLTELARETGAVPVEVHDAPTGVDLLIISIPEKSVVQLPPDLLRDFPSHGLVIDTGNYYPNQRDGVIDALTGTLTESEWVADRIGHPVLKVFNNILAQSLAEGGLPSGTPGRIALPVAGDDSAGKAGIIALLDEMGFDGLDAGPLRDSWRQQPGTPAYCTDLPITVLPRALASADRAQSPGIRDRAFEFFLQGLSGPEIVRSVRTLHPGLLEG